jgi:hypothetical protein
LNYLEKLASFSEFNVLPESFRELPRGLGKGGCGVDRPAVKAQRAQSKLTITTQLAPLPEGICLNRLGMQRTMFPEPTSERWCARM